MVMRIPITFFAPARREPIEVVHRQSARVGQTPLMRTFLNATLNYFFVLNAWRQIVMASENILELAPEYEDIRHIAKERGLPFIEVQRIVSEEARRSFKPG